MELNECEIRALEWLGLNHRYLCEVLPPGTIHLGRGRTMPGPPVEGIGVRKSAFDDFLTANNLRPREVLPSFYSRGWIENYAEILPGNWTGDYADFRPVERKEFYRITPAGCDAINAVQCGKMPTTAAYLDIEVNEVKRFVRRAGHQATVELAGSANGWHIFWACWEARGANAGDAVKNAYPNELSGIYTAVNVLNRKLAPLRIKVDEFCLADIDNLSKMKGDSKVRM